MAISLIMERVPTSSIRAGPSPRRLLGLIGSGGGHLAQLMPLRPVWERYDRFWVTFPTADVRSMLQGERVYWCHHPTNWNVPNLIRNTGVALKVLRRERVTHLIPTGAAVAVPFFYLGNIASSAGSLGGGRPPTMLDET